MITKWGAIPIGIMFMLLFIPVALAGEYDNWGKTCIGNVSVMSKLLIVDFSDIIPLSQNITCSFGCNNQTNMCNPGSPDSGERFMIVVGLIGIAALLLYIAIKLDKKYWEVQFLFLFLALFMILTSIYLISNLQNLSWTQASSVVTTNYTVVMWAIILFLFVIVIKFIVDVFQGWIKTRGKGSRRKK